MPTIPTLNTVSSKLIIKWFMIGLIVRLGLAVIVTLLMKNDLEASMLYFADIPTIFCLGVVERLFSRDFADQLAGSHPYYIPMNLLGSVLWGFLFVLVGLIVAAARRKLSAAKSH